MKFFQHHPFIELSNTASESHPTNVPTSSTQPFCHNTAHAGVTTSYRSNLMLVVYSHVSGKYPPPVYHHSGVLSLQWTNLSVNQLVSQPTGR